MSTPAFSTDRVLSYPVVALTAVPSFDRAVPSAGAAVPSFEEVYTACFPRVFRLARGLGVSAEAVDDVCQETFLVVHRRLHEFEGRSKITTWVSAICIGVVRNWRRTQTRKGAGFALRTQVTDPDQISGRDHSEQFATILHVTALLDALSPEKREVLVLSDMEGMSAREIGELLDLNPNTVTSRLRAARMEFRERADRVERAQD